MNWLSKIRGKARSQLIAASIPEIIRTRDEMLRLREQLHKMTLEAAIFKKEARLRQVIGIAMARYFIKGDRSPVASVPYGEIKADSDPNWIPGILARQDVSEPEFMAFKHFNNDAGTILDIGANYGYGAASIWCAGATSKIVSFEPNPWHLPCLQRIKEMRPGAFDYSGIGLGSTGSDIRFVIPVIEGCGISALSSSVIETEADWTIPENILQHMIHDHPELDAPQLQFAETVWRTERLDDALQNCRFDVDLSAITAIKIDVEGSEADVLNGASHTLATHTPLIMIEGANRNPAVVACLSAIGYRYADFLAGDVIMSDNASTQSNGFFLHDKKLGQYRSMGLLRG